MEDKPFFAKTQQLFAYVRDHDFARLAALCDNDFGIINIKAEGGMLVIGNCAE